MTETFSGNSLINNLDRSLLVKMIGFVSLWTLQVNEVTYERNGETISLTDKKFHTEFCMSF
jgi:hypothetical protein